MHDAGSMQTITLEITQQDYTIILGALRESCVAIDREEIHSRIGGTAAQILETSLKIRHQGDLLGLAE